MKLLFVRHGESVDDLTNQYGGWLDLDLTDKGQEQAKKASQDIKVLDVRFSRILCSPLQRAKMTAEILGSELEIDVKELVYLKERNKYGLLTGLTKEVAQEQYPDLVEQLNQGNVMGSESYDQLTERVAMCYELLLSSNSDIIAVSHGGFISCFIETIAGKNFEAIGDLGYLLWDCETKNIVASHGVTYS